MTAVDHTEHEHHAFILEDVEHHPVVAHSQSKEAIIATVDDLQRLPASLTGWAGPELHESRTDTALLVRGEFSELPGRR